MTPLLVENLPREEWGMFWIWSWTIFRDPGFPPRKRCSRVGFGRPLARVTDPEAEHVLIELWRRASTARKLAMVLSANETARALAMSGLRERHPGESPGRL